MAGQKREREVERARYERQQARRATRNQKTKRRERIIVTVLVAVLAVGGFAYLGTVLNNKDDSETVADPSTSPSASPSSSIEPSTMECDAPNGKTPSSKTYTEAPTPTLNADTTYAVTFATNCGDIKITLDSKNATKNAQSFWGLASDGYFDDTNCHRLTTAGIFVLQCGDPKGDGTGGPGFQLPDENLPKSGDNNYPAGTVAMANSGPNTAGSQFFLVYQDTTLDPNYTILGHMSPAALKLVKEVAKQGTADGKEDGTPNQPVQILTTTTKATPKAGS